MLRHPSSPTRTRGSPTAPLWPWPTTPTLPRPGAPQPTRTASSHTSAGTRGTARAGAGGAQRRHPRRRVAAAPLPPRRRPPPQRPTPRCVHPLLPPHRMGPGADAGPGHIPVHTTPLRPPHVSAPAGGGTLVATTGCAAGRTLGPATFCRWWVPCIACKCLGVTRYNSTARACPQPPSSCPSTAMLSSHNPYTAVSPSRPSASPGPVSWRWQPRITPDTFESGSKACLKPSLRPWPAS